MNLGAFNIADNFRVSRQREMVIEEDTPVCEVVKERKCENTGETKALGDLDRYKSICQGFVHNLVSTARNGRLKRYKVIWLGS